MSALVEALLAELDDDALDLLADRLRPRLVSSADDNGRSPWLNVAEAAEHIRCPKSRLYALTSSNRIPHCKDGSRTLFNRAELDAWLRAGGAVRP